MAFRKCTVRLVGTIRNSPEIAKNFCKNNYSLIFSFNFSIYEIISCFCINSLGLLLVIIKSYTLKSLTSIQKNT